MDRVIEELFDGIKKNLKNPRLYAGTVFLVIILALVFPYIDANFFYFNRIEKRVEILQSVSEIDEGEVSRNPILQQEYDDILREIESQKEMSLIRSSGQNDIRDSDGSVSLFKFLTGGALAWLIAVLVPFMNTFENGKTKITAIFLLGGIGLVLGGVGYLLPTAANPWINYLGFPALQLIALISLAVKSNSQSISAKVDTEP